MQYDCVFTHHAADFNTFTSFSPSMFLKFPFQKFCCTQRALTRYQITVSVIKQFNSSVIHPHLLHVQTVLWAQVRTQRRYSEKNPLKPLRAWGWSRGDQLQYVWYARDDDNIPSTVNMCKYCWRWQECNTDKTSIIFTFNNNCDRRDENYPQIWS